MRFVRADHYFNLYNQAHGIPFNLALSPQTTVAAGLLSTGAKFVMDGTHTTMWTAADRDHQWLKFDFGEDYEISRYVIRHAGEDGASPDSNTRGFTMLARSEGEETWMPIDVRKANRDNVTDVDVKLVKARFVKLRVDDPGEDGTARIAEMEIFGKGSSH